MPELFNSELNKNVEEPFSTDLNVSSHPNDLTNNQGRKSQSSDESMLPVVKRFDIVNPLSIRMPDLSGLHHFVNNYKAIQNIMAESIKPLLEIQDQVKKVIANMYEPMRRLAEISRTLNESFNTSFAVLRKPLRIMQAARSNQIVVWYNLNPDDGVELFDASYMDEILLDHFLRNEGKELNLLIHKCTASLQQRQGYTLFEQSISSFERKAYHTAILGFTSALDGVLSECSGSQSTSVLTRLEILRTKLLNQDDNTVTTEEINEFWLYSTLFPAIESFAAHAPFTEPEPELLNRHWIVHGRTTREYTLIHCIKVLSMIYGMLILSDYIKGQGQIP